MEFTLYLTYAQYNGDKNQFGLNLHYIRKHKKTLQLLQTNKCG